MKVSAVDYETKGIQSRPEYPPAPVGVAIKVGRTRRYYAWDHPTKNNCTKAEGVRAVKEVFRSTEPIFHNAAFDIEVGEEHLGIKRPPIFHCTEKLAYLIDPRFESLALKWLADNTLDLPPTEQTALYEWLAENCPEVQEMIGKMKRKDREAGKRPKGWGAYIAEAPGDLVGRYAIGDVVRTFALFDRFYPQVKSRGMLPAYEREMKVIGIKLKMERQGVLTAHRRLKRDLPKFEVAQQKLDARIKKRLKIDKAYEADCPKGFFNLSSGNQLADALEHAGKVDPDMWILTDKGNRSTKMDYLKMICPDKRLLIDLGMRSVLDTYINTFIGPWIETGARADGRIHPTFNQVRSTDDVYGGGTKGTKTGRPSSTNPNFNNIPADVEESKNRDVLIALSKYLKQSVGVSFIGLRDYIVPDEGCVLIARDYSQQELRVLAHYEDGLLLEMYVDNPKLDVHTMVQNMIYEQLGIKFPRKAIKIVAFTIIYGGGAGKVAFELDCPNDEAKQIITAYLDVLPGVRDLKRTLTRMAKRGEQIYTWGGRWYSPEEPRLVNGKMKDFSYKYLNLLIQGGSADITKQAMIQVDEGGLRGDIRLQVYDELLVNTRIEDLHEDMAVMKREMEDIELDCQLPTDGAYSRVSWGRMKDYRDRRAA